MDQAEPLDALSLSVTFQQLPDGRKKRGVRYPLALLLTLIVLVKLTGEVSRSGVVDWVRLRQEWLNQVLGLQQKRWPVSQPTPTRSPKWMPSNAPRSSPAR